MTFIQQNASMFYMRFLVIFLLIFLASAINAKPPVVSEYSLPNGLKVIIKEDHRSKVAVAQIWYKIGSSYDANGITGISHMLEHMMFRGTKKYGPGELDKIIVELGGMHNAFTGTDYTCYFEMLPSDKLPVILELESDRMQGLLLDEAVFTKEKQVVLEERKMQTEDSPEAQTMERFMATAFASNPYHTPVIGWMHDIQNFTITDIRSWYKNWYAPNNAVLVVVGDVKPEEVFAMAKKYFGKISSAKLPKIKPQKELTPLGKRTVTAKLPAKVPFILIGYNLPSLKTVEQKWKAYALALIRSILSGGDSSRLPKDLVRKQQIAASASASYNPYDRLDTLFILSATPNVSHPTKDLELALLQQVKKLQITPISKEELEMVKTQLIAMNTYKKDSIIAQAIEIGSLEAVGLPWQTMDHYIENIKAITPKQIQEVANEYFTPERLTVAELQPQPISNKKIDKCI